MLQILTDVHAIQRSCVGNVYLLAGNDALTLVDTGIARDTKAIAAELKHGSFSVRDLRQIVITHCHLDHSGGAADLVRRSGAKVLAHRAAVPYINQTQPLPYANRLQKALFWLGQRLIAKPCTVHGVLRDGDVLDALGGLEVIHTPGHTPGSICLYQPRRRVLFCGDLLITRPLLWGRPRLRVPLCYVSVNMTRVWESVRRMAGLEVEVLCPGHGAPILGNAGEMIRALLA